MTLKRIPIWILHSSSLKRKAQDFETFLLQENVRLAKHGVELKRMGRANLEPSLFPNWKSADIKVHTASHKAVVVFVIKADIGNLLELIRDLRGTGATCHFFIYSVGPLFDIWFELLKELEYLLPRSNFDFFASARDEEQQVMFKHHLDSYLGLDTGIDYLEELRKLDAQKTFSIPERDLSIHDKGWRNAIETCSAEEITRGLIANSKDLFGLGDTPPLLPSHGIVLYRIPTQMQLHNSHLCLVRIAIDIENLMRNLPASIKNPTLREHVRIARQMEVVFIPTPHFEIESINRPQQLIEFEDNTEWQFHVRPLHLGKYPLTLRISIVLPDGVKESVHTEAIEVVSHTVPEAMEQAMHNLLLENTPSANAPQQQDSSASNAPTKILFVSASPDGLVKIQVGTEFVRIRAALERGSQREKYELLQAETEATIEALVRAFARQPQIIHFSGHGRQEGILIATADNKPQLITNAMLKLLFAQLAGITQVVLLNACFAAIQAQEISKFGIHVIGYNRPISDPAALGFAEGLYIGLSEGKPLLNAYKDGLVILMSREANAETAIEVWKDGQKVIL
jgi:hypothetical protein